jgi:Kef-type K+ transport system membrane component KefB
VTWLSLAAVAALCGTADQWRVSLLPVYLLLLTLGVRPLLGRLLRRYAHHDRLPAGVLSLLASGLLLSCAATEWMGVHYIFGAFAFGAAMPRAGLGQFRTLVIQGMDQAGALLLPLYFVVAGSKVDLRGFGGTELLTLLALIAVACLTKTVGAYTGARIAGMPRDMALPVAALMNVRGLTEIVLLSVGLELHLIDDRIYSMMVVMAVVTTAMAGGLLKAFGVRSHEAPSAVATAPGQNEGTASGAKHMMLK